MALYAEQLGKEVGFYQDPCRITAFVVGAFRACVWLWTLEFIEGWTRIRCGVFPQVGAIDEPSIHRKPTVILHGRRRRSATTGQLKFRNSANGRRRVGPKLIFALSRTKCSMAERCRWTCWSAHGSMDCGRRRSEGCGGNSVPAQHPQRLEAAVIPQQLRHEWNSCPSRSCTSVVRSGA